MTIECFSFQFGNNVNVIRLMEMLSKSTASPHEMMNQDFCLESNLALSAACLLQNALCVGHCCARQAGEQ